jgi:hypothetical protein
MLISLEHRFVFVANPRCASTAIETVLRPWADIAITRTAFGKHDPLAAIAQRFAWVFDLVPRERFVVFGVMRDPAEHLASLWRFHAAPEFRGEPSWTGAMDFETFLAEWVPANPWQASPQWERFCDASGRFALDWLVDFARLDGQWPMLLQAIGLPAMDLPVANASAAAAPIDPATRARVAADRALDLHLLRGFAGRSLHGATTR